jgi:RND family efflux transporter MFP subunit
LLDGRHELSWRNLSLIEAGILVALVGTLVVQYARHGWPFTQPEPAPTAIAAHAPAPVPAGDDSMAGMPGMSDHADTTVPGRVPVHVDHARTSMIGMTVAMVERGDVGEPVRAVATIAPDESRVSHVHTRVAGWIQRLYVDTTGQPVRAGAPLLSIFSQELLSSQTEYVNARRSASGGTGVLASAQATIVSAGRDRLRVLGMSDAELAALDRTERPTHDVVITAPRTGVVLHRGVAVGTAVDPSTELLTVADLSRVWVFVEVPERAMPDVAVGTAVVLTFPSAGNQPIESRIEFLYPTLTEETRTLRARIALDNPDGRLRPGTYGVAEIRIASHQALTVPRDAVVDTGDEQHVFVVTHDGGYEPRRVVLGARLEDRLEVREGLEEGEHVVASGVFLLDSESRLRASGGGGGEGHAGHTGHAGHGG